MEKMDAYNAYRENKGYQINREDDRKTDDYHLVVHILIFNAKNELLIQQRHPRKDRWENLWDLSVSGVVKAGETSQDAAHRELKEELGLEYSFINVRPHLTASFHQGFSDFYIIEEDIDLNHLQTQASEVNNIKWANLTESMELISAKQFVPYYENLLPLLFNMKNGYGYIYH